MNKSRNFFSRFPDAPYLAALLALALLYWSHVLFSDAVLLPGDFLRGFAPFGSDPQAPWNILQWDALGQYFPWRFFAAQQLQGGLIPLWNPHQFSGTPFLANGQSAIFYPLSFPFWLFETARAFGISAFLHTLLASGSAYFLARRWNLSRAAALLGAIGFSFCGYLAAWIVLPTLSNTASWLPLLLLLFERACDRPTPRNDASTRETLSPHDAIPETKNAARESETARVASTRDAISSPDETLSGEKNVRSKNTLLDERDATRKIAIARDELSSRGAASPRVQNTRRDFALFALALASCFLAGHPQIFLYVGLALLLRAFTLSPILRALRVLALSGLGALCLGALQLLPFLELMRVGHRAGSIASAAGWREIAARALLPESLPSLFLPLPPLYSFDENKGYAGLIISLLALVALALLAQRALQRRKIGAPQSAAAPTSFSNRSRQRPTENQRPAEKASASTREKNVAAPPSSNVQRGSGDDNRADLNRADLRDFSGALSAETAAQNAAGRRASTRALLFCALLALFGLLFAMATPLPQFLYFYAPGFSQIGGVGRALLWWNFGAALLAAFALDALKNHARFSMFAALAILLVGAELFAASWNTQPTAPRATIYPRTQVTDFLQRETRDGARVLLITPREMWLPTEGFRAPRTHPPGVLMTNGATVYGLNDVSGYDSLSLKSYRAFVAQGEKDGAVSPPLNGNILLLNNPLSKQLDALNVRFVVSENELSPQVGEVVLRAENCIVYRRRVLAANVKQMRGADFAPGFRDGKYQPQSFRFGAFVSLCALALIGFLLVSPSRVLARRGA